jgi:hypothetical protein
MRSKRVARIQSAFRRALSSPYRKSAMSGSRTGYYRKAVVRRTYTKKSSYVTRRRPYRRYNRRLTTSQGTRKMRARF